MTSPSHIFLSYARDKETGKILALRLQEWLESHGIPCWRDESDTEPGQSWPSHIPQALEASRAMICVISAATGQNHWVKEEITLALREDVAMPILPVLAEPGIPLPYGLNQFQPVDLSTWDGAQLERLLQRIHNFDTASGGPMRRVDVAYLIAYLISLSALDPSRRRRCRGGVQ
jgi:hypothetical protein